VGGRGINCLEEKGRRTTGSSAEKNLSGRRQATASAQRGLSDRKKCFRFRGFEGEKGGRLKGKVGVTFGGAVRGGARRVLVKERWSRKGVLGGGSTPVKKGPLSNSKTRGGPSSHRGGGATYLGGWGWFFQTTGGVFSGGRCGVWLGGGRGIRERGGGGGACGDHTGQIVPARVQKGRRVRGGGSCASTTKTVQHAAVLPFKKTKGKKRYSRWAGFLSVMTKRICSRGRKKI